MLALNVKKSLPRGNIEKENYKELIIFNFQLFTHSNIFILQDIKPSILSLFTYFCSRHNAEDVINLFDPFTCEEEDDAFEEMFMDMLNVSTKFENIVC